MLKKVVLIILFCSLITYVSFAQKNKTSKASKSEQTVNKGKEKVIFHIGEHVYIKMKDGTEQAATIHGRHSTNKYWIREYHSSHRGLVHKKYMRHMDGDEFRALNPDKKNPKKKKN